MSFPKYKVLKCARGNSQSQGRTLDEFSEVLAELFRIKAQRQKASLVFYLHPAAQHRRAAFHLEPPYLLPTPPPPSGCYSDCATNGAV